MTVHPWNEALWRRLTSARPRSAHAWLFSGPDGLGKTDCAMAFARRLCGAAHDPHTATLFDAGNHPDVHVIARDLDVEGSDALVHRYARRHLEERRKGSKPKTVINIYQIRHLLEAIHTRAHGGGARVVLVLAADTMNRNAANALLKLLEEPPSDTVLILVTSQPQRLPATVRSRCTGAGFAIPPRPAARDWLASRVEAEQVDTALDLAGGAPLAALHLISGGRMALRGQWIRELEALFNGRKDVATVAETGVRMGLGDSLALSQKLLIDLVRTRMQAPAQRLFNPELQQWLQKRAQRLQLQATFDLIDTIGRLQQDLDGPLDSALLLEDTLLRMRGAVTGGA